MTDEELQELTKGVAWARPFAIAAARTMYPIIERQVRKRVAAELRDRAQLQAELACGGTLIRAADAVEHPPETFAEDRPVGLVPDEQS